MNAQGQVQAVRYSRNTDFKSLTEQPICLEVISCQSKTVKGLTLAESIGRTAPLLAFAPRPERLRIPCLAARDIFRLHLRSSFK